MQLLRADGSIETAQSNCSTQTKNQVCRSLTTLTLQLHTHPRMPQKNKKSSGAFRGYLLPVSRPEEAALDGGWQKRVGYIVDYQQLQSLWLVLRALFLWS